MKNLLFAFGLASALVFALAGQSAAPNFAGTWTLDKSQSQGLPQQYKFHERATWVITQTDKEISIYETFIGVAVANLPPSRPGRGGGGEPIGPSIYKLDGSKTTTRIGSLKFARQAILSSDGKTLELVEKRTLQSDREDTSTSRDKLSLSADGNVLTVIRHTEGSLRPPDSVLVFNK